MKPIDRIVSGHRLLAPLLRVTQMMLFGAALCSGWRSAYGQSGGVINYQGRVSVGGSLFSGTAQLKFALVNSNGTQFYWQSAPGVQPLGEPNAAVSVPVTNGLYGVVLGDTSVLNMASLPGNVFSSAVGQTAVNPIYLRVWFNDGTNGSQVLTPDQRLTPVAFALSASFAQTAATVPDGSISSSKLAAGVIPSGITAVSSDNTDTNLLASGYQLFYNVPAPAWASGSSSDQADPRSRAAGIWTGQQLFVWGGIGLSGGLLGNGGLYDPVADQWSPIISSSMLGARVGHCAVWTGQRVVVWGGLDQTGVQNSGGQYDPLQHIWIGSTATQGAPAGRMDPATAWTSQYMVIWGGQDGRGGVLNDTALYDPAANLWLTGGSAATGTPPAAASGAKAVWTGTSIFVWGGSSGTGYGGGGILDFSGGGVPRWRPVSATGAPSNRSEHSVVWTGQRVLVWGGKDSSGTLSDGAAYDPANDAWTAIVSVRAPSARYGHSAIWTGQEMLVVGGFGATGPVASGAAYNPASNSWRFLSTAGNPVARYGSVSVWTGSQALIFGGKTQADVPIASLQILNPQPAWYFYRHP